MSITDTLIKQILSAVTPMHRGAARADDEAPHDDVLPPDIFADAPELGVFLDRAPDSGESFPESPESLSILGTYRWMASPGLITLYQGNINAYWRSLIRHALRQFPFITVKDAEFVLELLVHSVNQHERFHYVCDFGRRLFGGRFDRWHEEALAVAWEWHWLRSQAWNSSYGRLHPTLRRIIVQAMFDHRAPGYRDWRQFAGLTAFQNAITAYVWPIASQVFAGTPLNFGAWMVTHVPDDRNRAWEERIAP